MLLLGITGALLLFNITQRWEHEKIANEFEYQASTHFKAIKRAIEINLELPHSLQHFYDSSNVVDRLEFT
ncbi:MAG: hypothetical protein COB71_00535 [Thiotrichales bacterium]|nr:MAG: hypothetical protein COB71_00535 [Thiotrichales bacterium]